MTVAVRRGLGGLLLSVVLVLVGWVLTYGPGLPDELVVVLIAGLVGVPVFLVWTGAALLLRR